jgi:hypothetical protein
MIAQIALGNSVQPTNNRNLGLWIAEPLEPNQKWVGTVSRKELTDFKHDLISFINENLSRPFIHLRTNCVLVTDGLIHLIASLLGRLKRQHSTVARAEFGHSEQGREVLATNLGAVEHSAKILRYYQTLSLK